MLPLNQSNGHLTPIPACWNLDTQSPARRRRGGGGGLQSDMREGGLEFWPVQDRRAEIRDHKNVNCRSQHVNRNMQGAGSKLLVV